jgi:hypothetical protein
MDCNKCGRHMVWRDGATYGPYGVDVENCRDPYYLCECGNEVDDEAPQKNIEAGDTAHNSRMSASREITGQHHAANVVRNTWPL